MAKSSDYNHNRSTSSNSTSDSFWGQIECDVNGHYLWEKQYLSGQNKVMSLSWTILVYNEQILRNGHCDTTENCFVIEKKWMEKN